MAEKKRMKSMLSTSKEEEVRGRGFGLIRGFSVSKADCLRVRATTPSFIVAVVEAFSQWIGYMFGELCVQFWSQKLITNTSGFYGRDFLAYTICDMNGNIASGGVDISVPSQLLATEDVISPRFRNENFYGTDTIQVSTMNKNRKNDLDIPILVEPIDDPPLVNRPPCFIMDKGSEEVSIFTRDRDKLEIQIYCIILGDEHRAILIVTVNNMGRYGCEDCTEMMSMRHVVEASVSLMRERPLSSLFAHEGNSRREETWDIFSFHTNWRQASQDFELSNVQNSHEGTVSV
ncbi:hypothetical protein RND71_001920 [Anisodus tanguticus]|uniref:Uncharacterized protein n=1 Tax=Anisodus tanguticus TaxID=243964 RepID=A0AAE1T264_9SOLA|nr:hypothetical protein RND71_001920 [Anisodus tanguticus]